MIWGFADVTISTNLARDLGTRIVAAIFWGSDAFGHYAAISVLVNVPATIFATLVRIQGAPFFLFRTVLRGTPLSFS
jgi:glycerol uptake facilitator-like aquaporin